MVKTPVSWSGISALIRQLESLWKGLGYAFPRCEELVAGGLSSSVTKTPSEDSLAIKISSDPLLVSVVVPKVAVS